MVTGPTIQAIALTVVVAVTLRTVKFSLAHYREDIRDVTAQHAYPSRFLRLRAYIRTIVTTVLGQVFPCVLKPWAISTPFRVEYQSAAAEVAGVAVVRVKLCSDRAREALITVKRDKGFGVNRHSIGPLPCDAQG
ncbi:hypothetical protein YA32_22770 [Klebsiella aerogenes]|nr:hypothetical protein YA32_22770 [Klebsiella aerogenes]